MNNAYTPYDASFFQINKDAVITSCETIVPWIIDLLKPSSIVDFGCARGVWLSVFRKHGIMDMVGVDGSYVDRSTLEIPQECFHVAEFSEPVDLGRTFDLVLSLEVAEHLPAHDADQFVSLLTRHGSVVLFSAAIPYQGGTNHFNERWPAYWSEKFAQKGYACFDIVRPQFWEHPEVAYYYAQNILLFVKEDPILHSSLLKRGYQPIKTPMNLVHPVLYLQRLPIVESTLGQHRHDCGVMAYQAARQAARQNKPWQFVNHVATACVLNPSYVMQEIRSWFKEHLSFKSKSV